MRSIFVLTLSFSLLCFGAGCVAAGARKDIHEEPQCVSVDQALSSIGSAEGDVVSVCGFFKYEFEDKNLYSTERAARDQSSKHCLAIGKREGFSEDLSAWTGQRVRISGILTADFCPPGTLCPAACSNSGVFVETIEGNRPRAR